MHLDLDLHLDLDPNLSLDRDLDLHLSPSLNLNLDLDLSLDLDLELDLNLTFTLTLDPDPNLQWPIDTFAASTTPYATTISLSARRLALPPPSSVPQVARSRSRSCLVYWPYSTTVHSSPPFQTSAASVACHCGSRPSLYSA
mmetsp:Transcript_18536/g.37514  ORF Transcript_18536/g.37514 Transcript_18536/m.37514 type:complete len:142 (+) Transcript_18536:25-450(+)